MTWTRAAPAVASSFALALALTACAARRHPLDSAAVLDRLEVAPSAEVKHVLIGWKWLDVAYRKAGMTLDERAQNRTESAAEEVTRQVFERLLAGEKIEALMREVSDRDFGECGKTAASDAPKGREAQPESIHAARRRGAGFTRGPVGDLRR